MEAKSSLHTLRRATTLFGGVAGLAALLDVSPEALAEWLRAESVAPAEIVSLAEDIVSGRLCSLRVARDGKAHGNNSPSRAAGRY